LTNDVINGESKEDLPKWIGVTGIVNKLDETIAKLEEIAQNTDSAFTNTEWTDTEPPKFTQRLTDIYASYKDKTLTNPNPANSLKAGVTKLSPTYISGLGDYAKTNTTLNTIYQEFDVKINVSIAMINQAKDSADQIRINLDPIKQSIEEVKKSLDIDQPMLQINATIVDPFFRTVN
jgi:tetrahydromethanopterin S-methyltransferase subunit B